MYPNGDHYAFLKPDFSEGTFGHPWEPSLCVIGPRMIDSLARSLSTWLPSNVSMARSRSARCSNLRDLRGVSIAPDGTTACSMRANRWSDTDVVDNSLKPEDISHAVSHALRHDPATYGLTLDAQGWVEIDDLLAALRWKGSAWAGVDQAALDEMIATSRKQRHEVSGSRIRAYYGHSVDGQIERPAIDPPAVLFHGTSPEAWERIQRDGLSPMSRQNVHLSTDRETAILVGKRKSASPVVVRIDAPSAKAAGTTFSLGNENVWLASEVPARFLVLDEH